MLLPRPLPDPNARAWPGPNGNTFFAWFERQFAQLRLELPPTAIGKDDLPGGMAFGSAPSKTGCQFSLFGLGGLLLALEEGVELNVLGITASVDCYPLAIKLPRVGRIGFEEIRDRSTAAMWVCGKLSLLLNFSPKRMHTP